MILSRAFNQVIACLGLPGMASLLIELRTKEIGIRKVNGARIKDILILLNKEFMIWILIATVLAIPLSWYIMNIWSDNYSYHPSPSSWLFIYTGLIAMALSWITVSYHSIRASIKNPIGTLRYE